MRRELTALRTESRKVSYGQKFPRYSFEQPSLNPAIPSTVLDFELCSINNMVSIPEDRDESLIPFSMGKMPLEGVSPFSLRNEIQTPKNIINLISKNTFRDAKKKDSHKTVKLRIEAPAQAQAKAKVQAQALTKSGGADQGCSGALTLRGTTSRFSKSRRLERPSKPSSRRR